MLMLVELLAPGVEHSETADLRPEMLRAPEGGGPTQRDGAEGPLLRAREDGPIASQKGVAMLTHDLGHFQRRPTHGRVSRLAGKARASRGLSVAWSAGWATWR